MVAALAYVEAPPVTPLPYGLLSAATVIDAGGGHWQMGAQYEPDYCGPAFTTEAACVPAEEKEGTDDWKVGEFSPFVVYLLTQCSTVGGWDRARARVERGLTLGEGRAVEGRFAYLLAHDPDSVVLPGSPLGPLEPKVALAYLEEQAAILYGGVPTIHASRGTVSMLGKRVESSSNRLTTIQGATVASYSLPATALAPQGRTGSFMWATGPVTIRRGDIEVSGPVLGVGEHGPINTANALGERPYAVAWECFAIAVEVTPLLLEEES